MSEIKVESIQFELNQPVEITLGFDVPKTGESQHGTWYLYGGKVGGINKNFFASEKLHEDIQAGGYKKGSVIIITKKAKQGEHGLFSIYTVEGKDAKKEESMSEVLPKSKIIPNTDNGDGKKVENQEAAPQQNVWDEKDKRMARMNALNRGFDYIISRKLAIEDAFSIANMCVQFIWTGKIPEPIFMPHKEKLERLYAMVKEMEVEDLMKDFIVTFYGMKKGTDLLDNPNYLRDCFDIWEAGYFSWQEGKKELGQVKTEIADLIKKEKSAEKEMKEANNDKSPEITDYFSL